MSQVSWSALAVLVLIPLTAAPAAAQRIGVGYQFMQAVERHGYQFPAGWLLSVGGDTRRTVSAVVEAGGAYHPEERNSLQLWSLQGGIRASVPTSGRIRPYGQILGGVIGAQCCGEAVAAVLFEPGGGVEFPLTRRLSAQVAAGLPIVAGAGGTRLLRVRAGLVFTPW